MSKLIRREIEAQFSITNLRRVFHAATTEESKAGIEWYTNAHAIAVGSTQKQTRCNAGAIAALSPGLAWDRNVSEFRRLQADDEQGPKFQTGINWRKACSISFGTEPLEVLSGPKTRAFYMNICYPFSGAAVTIDRHAYSALAGRSLTGRELQAMDLGSYAKATDAYVQLAEENELLPCQAQAVVWVVWRRLKNRKSIEVMIDE